MSAETYKVRVTKDHMVFSAGHFITFNGNVCERLHGHNWRVAAEIAGPLDENSYVFDFIALRDKLQAIIDGLDHRVLLPATHPTIHIQSDEREVTATFEDRRWIFPKEDCVILPVANTTAELIANWIAHQFIETAEIASPIETVQIEVEENFGQWAVCRVPIDKSA